MKNPMIKATMAVSVIALATLVGCANGAPTSADSQMSVRQIDKVNSKVTGDKVAPVKAGMGSVSVKILSANVRRVLYTKDDIQALVFALVNDADPNLTYSQTFTQAQIGAISTTISLLGVQAGTYTAFVNAYSGPDPMDPANTNIGVNGQPATQNNVVVNAGENTALNIGLTLADDPPAGAGTASAQIFITDGN